MLPALQSLKVTQWRSINHPTLHVSSKTIKLKIATQHFRCKQTDDYRTSRILPAKPIGGRLMLVPPSEVS